MKHIEISVPGACNLLDIYGKDLKAIDTEKLVIRDGNKTIAVFSTFYYWRRVDGDDTKDDKNNPDKEAEQRIIQKKGKVYSISYLSGVLYAGRDWLKNGHKEEADKRFKVVMDAFDDLKEGKATIGPFCKNLK